MMRKHLCRLLSLALCGAFAMLGGCSFVDLRDKLTSGSEEKQESSISETASEVEESESSSAPKDSSVSTSDNEEQASEEEENVSLVYNAELCQYFTNLVNGNTLYVNSVATVKTTGNLSGTIIGDGEAEEIFIDGKYGATLTATGSGIGAIKGAEGTTLVFKNLTIRDNSIVSSSTSDRREGYLEFGGKLRFENCKFACAAYLCDDADAEFINCEFNSGAENLYAMWISDGSATFKNCEFEGWRAIKLYEGSDNRYTSVQPHFDVENILIEGCLFEGLQKKPGIAIDVFQGEATSIIIRNSEFNRCKQWTNDSYEGLLNVYESDVDTSTITFVLEEVTSDGNPVDWEWDREFGKGNPNP